MVVSSFTNWKSNPTNKVLWLNPSVDSDKESVHSMNAGDDGSSVASLSNANDPVVDLTLPTSASVDLTHKAVFGDLSLLSFTLVNRLFSM